MNTITKAVLLLFAFTFISCDKDFNTLGSDIVGDENFNFEKYPVQNLVTYTEPTLAVQSNNLPINGLGYYDNPVFGKTKAHIVSQMEMITTNPNIGFNHFIHETDSVYVYIPFFSTIESTDAFGASTFRLDSIYGNKTNGKIDLKIYENGYFLNNFDPNDDFVSSQKYYTDDKSLITNNIVSSTGLLNDSPDTSQNSEVTISNKQYTIYKTNGNGVNLTVDGSETTNPLFYVVKERKSPGLWINLNKAKFKERILDEVANGKLFNNNVFKQHFKGLYFEADKSGVNESFFAKLDLTKAEVVLQYHYYTTAQVGTPDIANSLKGSIKFRLGYSSSTSVANKANTINLIETEPTQEYKDVIDGVSTPENQGRLFVKGGENGTIAFVDVFGPDNDSNGIADELDYIRSKGWLVNEANLIFYVDQNQMVGSNLYEPNRIYIYDATNTSALIDYTLDTSILSSNIKYSKYVFGGIGEKSADGKIYKYKFRITEYIRNLVKETENVTRNNLKLGVVVTESINRSDFGKIRMPITTNSIDKVPISSVMNPLGTILHGTQSTDVAKKLKLEIYYTEPN